MKIVGIDEAGRGCIIGNLVMCAGLIDDSDATKLRNLGVKDSKLLSPKKRERLAEVLPHFMRYELLTISPKEIDNAVFSETTNLNWLEADGAVKLIHSLPSEKVVIDCPSPNTVAYAKYIKDRLTSGVNLVAEHKADVNYAVVAAASILAKVKRDQDIADLKKKIGVDFGSGYPSDPKTKSFLVNNWQKHSELFRHSWAPYRKLSGK